MKALRWWMAVAASVCMWLPASADKAASPRQLVADATEAYLAGDYEECGPRYVAAMEAGASGRTVAYNAACCYALGGEAERALELLERSVERGWRDVDHLDSDPDLESLHGHPGWAKIREGAAANRSAYLEKVNQELLEIYEQDQADRTGDIDWSEVGRRDEQRRGRVAEMLEAGAVKSADDHYHAAMVFQHGHDPEDYALAHELALKAATMDPEHASARWLAAAAKDRHLQSLGRPQIYGTQFRKVGDTWTLEPIDETAVTDEEREKWGVPPLAEARKRVEAMNARDKE